MFGISPTCGLALDQLSALPRKGLKIDALQDLGLSNEWGTPEDSRMERAVLLEYRRQPVNIVIVRIEN